MLLSSSIARSAFLLASLLPAVRSAVFDVTVGGPAGLKYDPEFVNAAPGDQIRFIFRAKNHTATQSTLANPCSPAPGGFDSSYVPVDPSLTEGFPVAELNITNTNPIYVYCKQGNHCSSGMVFAVNASPERFAAFKANALAAAPATPPDASASSSGAPAASAPVSTPATPTSSTPSPSASGTEHRVLVGANGLTFEPSNLKASPGDKIVFEFRAKNHTVTQSSFSDPCSPLAKSTPGQIGFDSLYQFVEPGSLNFPTYEITVNDTRPIWAYCAQGTHCQAGMVFSVNAADSGERTHAAFSDLAKAASQNGDGGYGAPAGGDDGSAMSIRTSFAGAAIAVLASVLLL